MFNICTNATKQGYSNYKLLIQIVSTFCVVDFLVSEEAAVMRYYGGLWKCWHALVCFCPSQK